VHQGRGGRPKIARLLGRPEAAVARRIVAAARSAQVAPTVFAGLRRIETTYLYEDPEHPERVTSSFQSAEYTPADQALLMGLAAAEEQSKHSRQGNCVCGFPIEVAWHSDLNGWWQVDEYVCEVCTVRKGEQVTHKLVRNTWPPDKPLTPFSLDSTVTKLE